MNMTGYDKDEVSMLSDVHPQLFDENVDSRFQAVISRTRSASVSIPMNMMESYENETNLVGHTGPLRSERRAPMIQMSGPIYPNRKSENFFRLNHGAPGHKIVEPKAEKFNGMDQHDWTADTYAGKNEHLLRSGQLGLCNDPDCTTCPTYYNFKTAQQKHSKASAIFDPKLLSCRKVLEAERYNWAATRGVNEEKLLEKLPENLQRDIRRHLFKFVKKVWIFALMDDHVLDAICEKLKPKIYIQGSEILYHGGLVEKMVFIVRGKLESIGEEGTIIPLFEGNVCGEELLTWCLEYSSVSKYGKKIKISGQRLLSSRTVRCLTNVEAFSLRAADLEEVTDLFARNLRNPRVQGAIRYESPYWRGLAATRIQVAWRYRQKCLKRMNTSQSNESKN